MTERLRMEGVATLLSSLSHGGDHAGTVQMLRRERIVQPDGSIEEVPVVSGNAWRGVLRDHSAHLLWSQLGEPDLPLPVFHALWSGGALTKAGTGSVLGSRELRTLRQLVPHVALFGAAGGGRILEGKLMVGKLVPICRETAHIVPPESLPAHPESYMSMLQIEEFSRMDDAKRGWADRPLGRAAELTGGDTLPVPAAEPEEPEAAPQQMRYGTETIAAGCRLHFWLALQQVTELEVEAMMLALGSWARAGAHIGGRSSTGHGRLALDCESWSVAPARLTGSGLARTMGTALRDHVESHRTEIIEAIGWLA